MIHFKLKKIISLLLSLSILLSFSAVYGFSAYAETSGSFTYTVKNGTAEITGYSGNEKALEIPSRLGGYTVTGVAANTFFYADKLESITFPETVTDISTSVFQGYVKIKEINVSPNNKVYSSKDGVLFDKQQSRLIIYPFANENPSYIIPNTVKTIASYAFFNSSDLIELTIPNSVVSIENYAFDSCTALKELIIPASVSKIGDNVFHRCLSLSCFTVSDESSSFADDNGVLYNKAGTNLICYPPAKADSSYSVLNTAVSVNAYAFCDAQNLTDVTIPNGLKAIGMYAFKGCTALKEIVIPESVTNVDSGAFHGCVSLNSAKLPASLTAINEDVFYNCSNLTSVNIPNGVTVIGKHAFDGCLKLNNVTIPSGVEKIEACAFRNCASLTAVNIPEAVYIIGDNAFYGCKNIADVYYAGSKTEWSSLNIGAGNQVLNAAKLHFGKLSFVDLKAYESYTDYVKYTSLYNEFIAGTNPPQYTKFSPDNSVTRAMFVAILYRMAGSPYDSKNPHRTNPFTDVSTTVYYYNAACWALDNGITNQRTFKPNNAVTREQTARFLFAYAQKNNLLGSSDYKNVNLSKYPDYNQVSSWAVEPLQWANYNNMITGTQQGYINPKGATKRIHSTRILYGFGKACNIGNFK